MFKDDVVFFKSDETPRNKRRRRKTRRKKILKVHIEKIKAELLKRKKIGQEEQKKKKLTTAGKNFISIEYSNYFWKNHFKAAISGDFCRRRCCCRCCCCRRRRRRRNRSISEEWALIWTNSKQFCSTFYPRLSFGFSRYQGDWRMITKKVWEVPRLKKTCWEYKLIIIVASHTTADNSNREHPTTHLL